MKQIKLVVLAGFAAVSQLVGAQESTAFSLPGQAEGTGLEKYELADRKTHESLRHPFVMLYYVEPTVKQGDVAKISYYVTDFAHSKVRLGDDSHRFDVVLQWSTDKATWQKRVQKGVKSGDGVFEIPDLKRGDYFIKILCRDEKGVLSRTVWSEFRVRTADELSIKATETARPTAADLVKAGVTLEKDGFYAFEPVDIGDIEPERNIRDQIKYNAKNMAAAKKALHDSINAKVAAAIASEAGKKLVAAHPEGYVVFAPAKDGHFIYRARDFRKIVPGASDAEDGWDGMQNMTYRNIRCHDNPNGDFTVCCGHSFVYENCSMRFSVNQRVHSALFRNCTINGGTWDCLTLTRDGYKRFENNTFVRGITLGTPKWSLERKKVPTDWEIVLNDAVFKGKSAEDPMRVEVGLTGRYRNCKFENCQLVGPKERFTSCTFGSGCSTAEK